VRALSYALHDAETALVETEKLRKENTLWKSKVHESQKACLNEGHQQLTLDKELEEGWQVTSKMENHNSSRRCIMYRYNGVQAGWAGQNWG